MHVNEARCIFDETSGTNHLKIENVECKVDLHLNAGKTKLMQIGVFDDEEVNTIQDEGEYIERV